MITIFHFFFVWMDPLDLSPAHEVYHSAYRRRGSRSSSHVWIPFRSSRSSSHNHLQMLDEKRTM
jgi:hypothetical protein